MPFTDSEAVPVTLPLLGVWIHDPLDPQGSAAHFQFGASSRDTAIDAMGAGSFFAGRSSPVFDYGEHESEVYGVSIEVPHGPTYRADLVKLEAFSKSKRTLWFRDNRGRAMLGTMGGFKHSDQDWGSTVTFTFERTHRDIEETVA